MESVGGWRWEVLEEDVDVLVGRWCIIVEEVAVLVGRFLLRRLWLRARVGCVGSGGRSM